LSTCPFWMMDVNPESINQSIWNNQSINQSMVMTNYVIPSPLEFPTSLMGNVPQKLYYEDHRV
jgi:hypothetical protein